MRDDNAPMPGIPWTWHLPNAASAARWRSARASSCRASPGLVRERVIAHYLGNSRRRRRVPRGAAHPEPPAEPARRGRAVGVVHPGLRAAAAPRAATRRRRGSRARSARCSRWSRALIALARRARGARRSSTCSRPGFTATTRELTITLVRILFPGVALLVMSAWCLGVLNSHRKFFLSYVSPVLWNAALIATRDRRGPPARRRTTTTSRSWLAWGAVIGSAAQFLVQLPTVIALLARPARRRSRCAIRACSATLRAFVPVVLGRGSVQLSGVHRSGARELPRRGHRRRDGQRADARTCCRSSLFGMAVSAAELPEMSSATGDDADARRAPADAAAPRAAPRRVPRRAVGGRVRRDRRADRRAAVPDRPVRRARHARSCGSSSPARRSACRPARRAACSARRSTRSAIRSRRCTPRSSASRSPASPATARAAAARALPRSATRLLVGYAPEWGAFGLTASAGFAAWIEFLLLRRWLAQRIGKVPIPTRLGLGCARRRRRSPAPRRTATQPARRRARARHIAPRAIAAIAVFGLVYFAIATIAKVPEAHAFTGKITRRFRRR